MSSFLIHFYVWRVGGTSVVSCPDYVSPAGAKNAVWERDEQVGAGALYSEMHTNNHAKRAMDRSELAGLSAEELIAKRDSIEEEIRKQLELLDMVRSHDSAATCSDVSVKLFVKDYSTMLVSEPDPRKIEKEGLVNGAGWKCTLRNVRNFINCGTFRSQ